MDTDFLTWVGEGNWVLPVLGASFVYLALAFGWRYFTARPAAQQTPEALFEADFLSGLPKERRRAPRRSGNPIEVCLSTRPEDDPVPGWLLDRSLGGLGILVNSPVAIGTVFRVRAKETITTAPWIEITVRFSHPHGNQHELGCQFNRVPSWNDLMQFG